MHCDQEHFTSAGAARVAGVLADPSLAGVTTSPRWSSPEARDERGRQLAAALACRNTGKLVSRRDILATLFFVSSRTCA